MNYDVSTGMYSFETDPGEESLVAYAGASAVTGALGTAIGGGAIYDALTGHELGAIGSGAVSVALAGVAVVTGLLARRQAREFAAELAE